MSSDGYIVSWKQIPEKHTSEQRMKEFSEKVSFKMGSKSLVVVSQVERTNTSANMKF